MPEYEIAGQRVRRKHTYMLCAIGPRFDEATPGGAGAHPEGDVLG
jgi:hypothetical protein